VPRHKSCPRCKGRVSKSSGSGFCGKCAAEINAELAASGLVERGGATVSDLKTWWEQNKGEPIESKAKTPAEYVADVARENQIVYDWNAKEVTLAEDCIVVSDIHIPQHDPEYLKAVCKAAIAHDLTTLVIGGDLIDCQELSSFIKDSPTAHSARESLRRTMLVLGALRRVFSTIVVIGGNHEAVRLQRVMDQAVAGRTKAAWILADIDPDESEAVSYEERYVWIMERWNKLVNGTDGGVRFRPETHCFISGSGGKTLVTHQSNSSRRPPYEGLNHWQREQCNIICTHTHLSGWVVAPNGKDAICNIGTGSKREYHRYAVRHDNAWPEWVQAMAIVTDGVPELLTVKSHPRRWKEIEAAYAAKVS
jgi:predicted phosphodiesterase